MPKRIVYYSIGGHSAQVVLLYIQIFQHKVFKYVLSTMDVSKESISKFYKVFNFNFIKQLLFINESIGFLLVICRF